MKLLGQPAALLGRRAHYWLTPVLYIAAAILLGFIMPRIDRDYLQASWQMVSVASETAILSSIASGMMALTAIVFSMVLVSLQVAGSAYSPRLVQWLVHDVIMGHALGAFTGTFLFALLALSAVDLRNSGSVPIATTAMALVWLLVSIGMLIALIERVSQLYVTNVLTGVGDAGRKVIHSLYITSAPSKAAAPAADTAETPETTQKLHYIGPPRVVIALDTARLTRLARAAGGCIVVEYAVGDLVADGLPIARSCGAKRSLDEHAVRRAIILGRERTTQQDPKYAIRLLVDIAIRALSPAVNDPTTAVQALNQIDDLLRRLGRAPLDVGRIADRYGVLRLVYPTPTWEDFLDLALLEIMYYGANSVQVMRRLGALLDDLEQIVLPERKAEVLTYQERLHSSILHSFRKSDVREEAEESDRQGLGLTRREE